jgi:nitrous oxide reductase accessory protein NosL
MRRFNFLLFFVGILFFVGSTGCEKKQKGVAEQMHWDRDMCERCKMAISERKFAVQIVDPKTDRHYKFDDIGCAVLWMDEEKIPWKDGAIIWITDAKSGKWIDARKARYVAGAITPMAFGFAAYTEETLPQGAKVLDFATISRKIAEIEKQNSKKVKAY